MILYNAMKIAFDAKRLFNNNTGLGNYSRTIIDILAQYYPNNEYHLYTPIIKEQQFANIYNNIPCCKTINKNSKLIGSLWRSSMQASQMKKNHINIYHGLSNEITSGLKKNNIASVVTIHDLAYITFPTMYKGIDRMIYNHKTKKACKDADIIISISKSTENDIIKYYGIDAAKIKTVYQPVSPIYYQQLDKNTAATIVDKLDLPSEYMLYVGSINSRKNLLGIVEAINMMKQDNRIPLVVVGEGGEYKQKVLQYIAANNMQNQVIFLGRRNLTEIRALYTLARLFVYPSFYEGFGLPVVEAMLCGCPVVSSNTSSLPEAAGPNSLLADPYNTESIFHCIQQALGNTSLRSEMIEKGFQYAIANFSPKSQAAKIMDIYQSLM